MKKSENLTLESDKNRKSTRKKKQTVREDLRNRAKNGAILGKKLARNESAVWFRECEKWMQMRVFIWNNDKMPLTMRTVVRIFARACGSDVDPFLHVDLGNARGCDSRCRPARNRTGVRPMAWSCQICRCVCLLQNAVSAAVFAVFHHFYHPQHVLTIFPRRPFTRHV